MVHKKVFILQKCQLRNLKKVFISRLVPKNECLHVSYKEDYCENEDLVSELTANVQKKYKGIHIVSLDNHPQLLVWQFNNRSSEIC